MKEQTFKGEAAKKFERCRKAAEQGDAHAQFNLGVCYANGFGTTRDYEEAAIWFLRASEQGLAEAQNPAAFQTHQRLNP